ncbi:unnamed protein product [Heligmosomoides polygyrus]|uniref:Fibronectin type-III domain-containing protein n=1 Tax=Heligmosomoides polygyrus TaxID=6339 RepID=A0A3P8AFR0_HELPZ|nr:unnamed protein product [Heligmosomoides polygyrus]
MVHGYRTNLVVTSNRVIHLDWTSPNELFNSWFAYAICDYVTASTQKTTVATTKLKTSLPKKAATTPSSLTLPTNVEAVPLSPSSLSVSWTCCTNRKSNYTILYTHDSSIPPKHWQRRLATCRDSFGTTITGLPSDHDYTVCVIASELMNNASAFTPQSDNCAQLALSANTTRPESFEPVEIAPCNCLCDRGEAILRPTCDLAVDEYRPISTLPPATEGECPCKKFGVSPIADKMREARLRWYGHVLRGKEDSVRKIGLELEVSGKRPRGHPKQRCSDTLHMDMKIKAHAGRCPYGYVLTNGQCYDVDECAAANGGCSHGCVNTPGGHYCACPYGMTRDPLDPLTCINAANSFDRIAQLLAQYLHANSQEAGPPSGAGAALPPQRSKFKDHRKKQNLVEVFQATIKSSDDKSITFEWSSAPAVVRRAFRWLF